MTAATLFPTVLGAEFAALDPCVRWVHSGESRTLQGNVTVERGMSLLARALGALASLPSTMTNASIEVRIEPTRKGEKWTRLFAGGARMMSTLQREGDLLVEKVGPATLKFRVSARGGAMQWSLASIAALGIALPLRWFHVSAAIESRDGRYHFVVNSELRGAGRIVRYEGSLGAA
jgi:Domain of unknown function (DUF4166)